MASDGKAIISTELDNSGIEKGIEAISGMLGGLGNTVKKIAVMLAAAFSKNDDGLQQGIRISRAVVRP